MSGTVTIEEVSRHARVSPATVSRVLTGSAPVAEATRRRVLAAVEALGYRPNAFARALVTNRSGGIGVSVNEVSSPYSGAVIAGIERVTRSEGLHLMVCSGEARADAERAAIDFLLDRRADALVIQAEALDDDTVRSLVDGGAAPAVVFGRSIAGIEDACVVLDNVRGGEIATRHLLEHGHRRIGHIAGPLSFPDARDRLTGYRRALAAAGIDERPGDVAVADFREAGGARAAAALLERAPDLTAVFVANDQMAAGALRTLRELGRQVPRDVSVVGYDDVILAQYLTPALTTVRQPLVEMGAAAASLLLARLGGVTREVVHRFEPELVERSSVARAA